MKNIYIWAAVFVAGVATLLSYPTIASAGGTSSAIPGGVLLVPLGYLLAMTGAAGFFIAWSLMPAKIDE